MPTYDVESIGRCFLGVHLAPKTVAATATATTTTPPATLAPLPPAAGRRPALPGVSYRSDVSIRASDAPTSLAYRHMDVPKCQTIGTPMVHTRLKGAVVMVAGTAVCMLMPLLYLMLVLSDVEVSTTQYRSLQERLLDPVPLAGLMIGLGLHATVLMSWSAGIPFGTCLLGLVLLAGLVGSIQPTIGLGDGTDT